MPRADGERSAEQVNAMKRKILVTGASRGIGRAICEKLLSSGHSVVGVARDFTKFPCDDPKFRALELDLADLDRHPARLKSLAAKATGDEAVNAIVCNVGVGRFGSLEQFSNAQIRAQIDLNFLSHVYVVRALLPAMKTRGRGDIVFMGSEAGLRGRRNGTLYSAAKFAVKGFR